MVCDVFGGDKIGSREIRERRERREKREERREGGRGKRERARGYKSRLGYIGECKSFFDFLAVEELKTHVLEPHLSFQKVDSDGSLHQCSSGEDVAVVRVFPKGRLDPKISFGWMISQNSECFFYQEKGE